MKNTRDKDGFAQLWIELELPPLPTKEQEKEVEQERWCEIDVYGRNED
jgi:hypothetical protein